MSVGYTFVSMPSLRTFITDDGGNRVPLMASESILSLGPDHERHARLRAVANRPRPPLTAAEIRRGIRYGLLLLPLAMASGAAAPFVTSLNLPAWALILATLAMGGFPPIVFVILLRRWGRQRIARIYIDAGFCASCGYDLRGTEVQVDGLRMCPECGAAWR
jgi:hypothetical protein